MPEPDRERERFQAEAEALDLLVAERRQAETAVIGGDVDLEPALRRRAAQQLLDMIRGDEKLAALVDKAVDVGTLRAMVQVANELGIQGAAQAAESQFSRAWSDLGEIDDAFFARGAREAQEVAAKLEAVSRLLRMMAAPDA